MNHALRHLCIAVHTLDFSKTFGLNFTRTDNTLANGFAAFARLSAADILKRNWSYLALYIYSIEQGA